MKKLITIIVCVIALGFVGKQGMRLYKSRDAYIRDRVVKLMSERGSCTGVYVESNSGENYILTAAHCRVLVEEGMVTVQEYNGHKYFAAFVAEDDTSDLMLLTSESSKSVDIGDSLKRHDKVKTITHGHGLPLYRTDGEIIGNQVVTIPFDLIRTPDDAAKCGESYKHKVVGTFIGLACALSMSETVTTAQIVPGSSGGPVLNIYGELIGIVSAGDGSFGYIVKLSDIKEFLRDN